MLKGHHLAAALALCCASSARVAAASPDPDQIETGGYVFDGWAVWIGGGPAALGNVGRADPRDEAAFSSRVLVTFGINPWFAVEAGVLNGYFRTIDHHGDDIGVWETAITTGARFSLPPESAIRPWIAPRLVHLHFFDDPWSDHGVDGHASLNRWGLGAALGFDIGLGGPSSRWRFGFDAEALALSGPGINLLIHSMATIGVGF